jgi:hypothetical protein
MFKRKAPVYVSAGTFDSTLSWTFSINHKGCTYSLTWNMTAYCSESIRFGPGTRFIVNYDEVYNKLYSACPSKDKAYQEALREGIEKHIPSEVILS